MDTFILVLAGLGLFFLLFVLLLLLALSAGGGGRSNRRKAALPPPDSEPRRSARRGIPLWQLLLAVLFLCFTSEPDDEARHN